MRRVAPVALAVSLCLVAAGARAETREVEVSVSVVGTGRLPVSGYFRAKFAQEQLIKASGIPFSIVHATQFFEFVKGIAAAATQGTRCAWRPCSSSPWPPTTSPVR